ncbi:hypothetical protein NMY22_g13688 [Coprinellus aureogranulatus]|nr:hypothetical protein NMY22_g13688 [Coprinellus aureogranulatus]
MTSPDYGFLLNPSLPARSDIIAHCSQVGLQARGAPLYDTTSHAILAWVKYGPNVTIQEARTQDFTAKELSRTPNAGLRVPRVYDSFIWDRKSYPIGFIVMEYVEGADCDLRDVDIVAKAVQQLIAIRGPDNVPGHIGGKVLVHPFFLDWVSEAIYTSVDELQAHINNVLKIMKDRRRVNIVAEAEKGLFLCPSDLNPGNFRKSTAGELFALDFTATCFLPPSFFAVAVSRAFGNIFCRQVAQKVNYERPEDSVAITRVSGYLVPFGAQRGGREACNLYTPSRVLVVLQGQRRGRLVSASTDEISVCLRNENTATAGTAEAKPLCICVRPVRVHAGKVFNMAQRISQDVTLLTECDCV